MNRNLTGSASRRRPSLFLYFALLLQDAILFTQPGQFLTLRRRQRARLAFAAIDPRLLDPLAQRRLSQIEIPRRRADRLPFLEHEPDGPGLKLLTESPTRTLGLFVCHCGHRIRLSESVHEIGSSPNALGDDYVVLEDFDRAIDFIDRTLALVPRYPKAILSKAKALTYAGRYVDSLQVVDQLLAQKSLVGAARYWRALDEEALSRYDEAWADIELANKELFNAAVPKLAGIIAYHRKQLDVSRDEFELSLRRGRDDCETGFYLGVVLGEQGTWMRTADVVIDAVACFEKLETKLYGEIAKLRASPQPPV